MEHTERDLNARPERIGDHRDPACRELQLCEWFELYITTNAGHEPA